MSTLPGQDFAPLAVTSRWRAPFGILLGLLVGGAALLVTQLALFEPTITYRLRDGVLEVRGGSGLLGNRRTIPVASVVATEEVTLGRGRRTAGTAMPGYCGGRFSYDGLGGVWQVTDCRRRVLLLRLAGEERPVLLSPPDVAAFAAALAGARDGDFSPPPTPPPLSWRLFTLALLLAVAPAAVFAVLAVLLAPRRLRYRVWGGELEVQLLLCRRRFRLTGAHARRLTPSGRVWKIAGSAVPGYYAGWFSLDGQRTRLYASTVKAAGVLVEGERRVFVTPADSKGFLAALRAQGARVEE
jgi:hypothetical protein